MIESIAAISGAQLPDANASAAVVPTSDFLTWYQNEIAEVDQHIKIADQSLQKLALGETDNLHQVMLAISKAKAEFELTVEIRNRLVESAQEVMRMSI